MKLDRERFGRNKYGLIKNRRVDEIMVGTEEYTKMKLQDALTALKDLGVLDAGDSPDTEFFVMRLKDRFAGPALQTYAMHASAHDIEYGTEVNRLAKRSGMSHPFCKLPD